VAVGVAVLASGGAACALWGWRAERRRATALAAAERRFRDLFENARDLLFTLHPDGRIASVNGAIERITGRPRREFLGRPLADLATDPTQRQRIIEHIEKARQGSGIGTTQVRIQGRDGERVLELSSHGPSADSGVAVVQGMARDVTMRKQLEQGKLLTEQLEAVGRLSGAIAHDYNNLLTIIRGHAEQVRERLGPHLDHGAETGLTGGLDAILGATRRAELLTQQLLGHSRRSPCESTLLDLREVVDAAMHNLVCLLPDDIDCQVALTDEPTNVFADRGSLEQILLNLVLNARDAMPDGGKLEVSTHRRTFTTATVDGGSPIDAGSWVVLQVCDNGCGMDEQTRARVFEPFFTTKNPGRGTGLGLATVRSAMTRLGGHACVTSQPGEGACFKVYLPWSDVLPTPRREPANCAGSEHVLLVEDDDQVATVLRQTLTGAGYRVTDADSAEQALALDPAVLDSVDALVTDGSLTGMTGVELSRQLRLSRPELPVLLVSGIPPRQHEERIRFLMKPIAAADLLRGLRSALDAPRQALLDRPAG
jgi:PAS domain S-box-containing protein